MSIHPCRCYLFFSNWAVFNSNTLTTDKKCFTFILFMVIDGHSIMSSRGIIMGPFLYIFYSCTQENGHSVSITFDKKNTTFVLIFCNAKTWLFNTTLKCLCICSVYYAVQFAVWTWVLARTPLLAQVIDWFEHVVNNLEWTCSISRNH